MVFRSEVPVRFGDEDGAGVVYAPRHLHFFHCAWEDFWQSHGLSLRTGMQQHGIGWPVVQMEATFHRPVRSGEVLCIELSVMAIGRTSATVRCRGRTPDADVWAVEGKLKMVCVAMDGWRAQPIPSWQRAILAEHLLA